MNLYESISQETINSIKSNAIKKEIDLLIKDEEEAIDGYEKSKQTLSKYDISSDEYTKIVKVYDHIIDEEKEHIRELQELLGGNNMNIYESIKETLNEGVKYHYITHANDPASIGAEYEYNSMANTDVMDILHELKMYFNQAEKDAEEIIANATNDPGVYESDIEMCKFCAEKVQEMIDKMNKAWE